jgi:hypothetical protein
VADKFVKGCYPQKGWAMKDLIEKLENATGPDRGLEYEMFAKLVEPILDHDPPYYTASIDDALTLVPEGYAAILYTQHGTAELYESEAWPRKGIQFRSVDQKTVALALCIAALKARVAVERDLTKMEAAR